ncbi:MAG TPA: transcription termination/antitermination NusG family protein [Nitrospira sp.]|nr:transcription termination/antitermination NusG family protein [Nitrospira sp.]
MHWYVVRTKPHQEKQAEFHLRHLSVETFLPLLRQNKRIRRQEKTVVEALFPRYLFARFDINDRHRAVNFARGVLHIVEFGLKPAEVNESLIKAIRERMEDGYVSPAARFHKGQIVQINGGPLAGLEAVFVREMSEQHRVLLLLKTLGLRAKLTMDIDQVSLPQAL